MQNAEQIVKETPTETNSRGISVSHMIGTVSGVTYYRYMYINGMIFEAHDKSTETYNNSYALLNDKRYAVCKCSVLTHLVK